MVECWLIHSGHTRAVVFLAETFEMDFDRYRSNSGSEVKESVLIGAEPLSDIGSIGHGCRKSDHSNFGLFVHSADNNFQDSTPFLSEEMNFIENDQTYFFGVLSVF
jgi:hypothetical protein